jgi:hypothetical protein
VPTKARYMWFPQVARLDMTDRRYVDESAVADLHP